MKLFAIIVGKILCKIMSVFGRGTVYPGYIADKMSKNLLEKIVVKNPVTVVTGTNGKTSTTNAIAHILSNNNYQVVSNIKGSNMYNGILTAYLEKCTLTGKIKDHYPVLEIDEMSLPILLPLIKPKNFVLLNLYQDQLERLGSVENITQKIVSSLNMVQDVTVVTNLNHPITYYIAKQHPHILYQINNYEEANIYKNSCPSCGHSLYYSEIFYGDVGRFKCENCGFKSVDTANIEVINISNDLKEFRIGDVDFTMQTSNRYFLDNYTAAISVTNNMGVPLLDISKALTSFRVDNGRWEEFKLGNHKCLLNLTKNAVGLDQVLKSLEKVNDEKCLILIYNNTTDGNFKDTSWLWDVEMNIKKLKVKKVICSGKRAFDIANRVINSNIDQADVIIEENIEKAINISREIDYNKYLLCTRLPLQKIRSYLNNTKEVIK